MADDKWSQPAQPPPPLFVGEKERNLVKQVNDELIEKVIRVNPDLSRERYSSRTHTWVVGMVRNFK